MASISADEVRKRLGLTSTDINDSDVLKLRNEAASFLGDELGRVIDVVDCTESEASAVRSLAAIYCYCQVTGGVAVGLDFTVGDLHVKESTAKQVNWLIKQVQAFLRREKRFGVVLGSES